MWLSCYSLISLRVMICIKLGQVLRAARAHGLPSHPLPTISDATICFNPAGARTRVAGPFLRVEKLGQWRGSKLDTGKCTIVHRRGVIGSVEEPIVRRCTQAALKIGTKPACSGRRDMLRCLKVRYGGYADLESVWICRSGGSVKRWAQDW